MVGWVDVRDIDWGDFRCRCAVDDTPILSLLLFLLLSLSLLLFHMLVCCRRHTEVLLSHPGIPGVTLCFCTGSYAAAAAAAAGRRFLSTR